MENNKLILNFTKFFDVKSPLGINQKETADLPFSSIGVDIYMPRPTKEFIDAILKSNDNYSLGDMNTNDFKINHFSIFNKNSEIVLFFHNNIYRIYHKIQIPSGIGLIIPDGYHIDLRSKSSNFKNDYTTITGLIDCDYTFGMGIQIIPLKSDNIVLEVDEKVSQLVLIKSTKINVMNEIPLNQWEFLKEVIDRRQSRKGGFGHTGKFDK